MTGFTVMCVLLGGSDLDVLVDYFFLLFFFVSQYRDCPQRLWSLDFTSFVDGHIHCGRFVLLLCVISFAFEPDPNSSNELLVPAPQECHDGLRAQGIFFFRVCFEFFFVDCYFLVWC